MAVIIRGARRGLWDGRHVTKREDRFVPLFTCIGSLAVGIAALLLGGGPGRLVALAVAMFASLVVSVAITCALPVPSGRGWKISIHAAVAAGAVVVLTDDYGPWLLPPSLSSPGRAWSSATTPHFKSSAARHLARSSGGLSYWLLA